MKKKKANVIELADKTTETLKKIENWKLIKTSKSFTLKGRNIVCFDMNDSVRTICSIYWAQTNVKTRQWQKLFRKS